MLFIQKFKLQSQKVLNISRKLELHIEQMLGEMCGLTESIPLQPELTAAHYGQTIYGDCSRRFIFYLFGGGRVVGTPNEAEADVGGDNCLYYR